MEFKVNFHCRYWGPICGACYMDRGDYYIIHLAALERFADKRDIDYVEALGEIAVHELIHSLGIDHSQKYWRSLRRADYEAARELDRWPF